MAALRLLALFVLLFLLPLQLHAIATAYSDGALLLVAKSALSDPTGALAGWHPGSGRSPCRWPYVSCLDDSADAVAALNLSRLSLTGEFPGVLCSLRALELLDVSFNDLVGPLPACLAALPALKHLNFAGNNFSGEVPPAWGAGFRSLAVLNLLQNLLTGAFPTFVANLTSVQELLLAYNDFSPSPLPENLGDLAELRIMYVANCSLIGKIPSSIVRLRNLVNLDLSSNNLTGEIPSGIRNLTSLEQIELYSNHLSGNIPVGLGGLKRLRMLDMSMNQLTGKIPADMFTAPRLDSVHMYQNNLTGRLPATLATAPSLSDLRMFSNQLEGPLPREFGKNCPLELLDLSDNRLSGPIPATLCASGKLRQIMLLDNEFEGAIPVELGQCRTLTRIRLQSNRLSGPVAPEIWGLPNVVLLELRDNALSGTIDAAIAGAKNLTKLFIQDNQFTGALPAELGTLPLQDLVASNNRFSGSLPPSFAEFSEIFKLDLSNNSLSGGILPGFCKLKSLIVLDLSNNHLSGSIPPEIGDIVELNYLDLSNNELSGTLPVQLANMKVSHFNVSFNKLSGPIPGFFNGLKFQDSFLGNPGLCYGFCQSSGSFGSSRHIIVKFVVAVLIVTLFLLLLSIARFSYKSRNREGVDAESEYGESSWVLTSFHKLDFSERDIVKSLTENNLIGQGAAGKVYKAVVGPYGEAVAVKKLLGSSGANQRNDTFEAEVETLNQVRHKNIVKLVCCITNRVCRLLVYEYMPNGSLGDFLHSAKSSILAWPMRYKIACDAAEGLSYLHHDCVPPIIHRDVKSNNILLDTDFGAKVADFGVAKTMGNGPATMSSIAGSYGYIAPEYAYTLRVTEKSDTYSFGVVLLELVTGKKPMAPEVNEMDLVTWVSSRIELNGPESVLDQTLDAQFKDEVSKVLQIAQHCVANIPNHRPPMRAVVNMLKEVKGVSQPKLRQEVSPAI